MKIAVIGATGGTGKLVLQSGLDKGHDMVGLARRPEEIQMVSKRLSTARIDAYDSDSLAAGMAGCDAFVSCIGAGGLFASRKAAGLLAGTAKPMIDGARKAGVNRCVIMSSVGVVEDPDEEWVYRHIIKKILRPYYDDMATMEAIFNASDLNYTLLRPPLLQDKPARGDYRTQEGFVERGYRISRRDTADFIVKLLQDNLYVRKPVGIAY